MKSVRSFNCKVSFNSQMEAEQIFFLSAKQQNRSSYSRIWFKPRILVPVGQVDYSTTVMTNTKTSLPIYISPAAMAKLGHPDGELNLTRAAGQMGIVQGVGVSDHLGASSITSSHTSNPLPP